MNETIEIVIRKIEGECGIKIFSLVKIKLRLHKGYIKSGTVFYIDKIDKIKPQLER